MATAWITSTGTGSCSTPDNAHGATDGTFTTDTGNTSWSQRWDYGTPNTGGYSGTVTFTLRVRKQSNPSGNNPTVDSVAVRVNGPVFATDSTGWDVTSGTSQDIVVTFTPDGTWDNASIAVDVATTGAAGSPTSRNAVQVDSILFTYTEDAARSFSLVGAVTAPVAALTFEVANDVAVTGSISGPTAAITAEVGNDVAVAGTVSAPVAALTFEVGNDVAVTGSISGPTAAISIDSVANGDWVDEGYGDTGYFLHNFDSSGTDLYSGLPTFAPITSGGTDFSGASIDPDDLEDPGGTYRRDSGLTGGSFTNFTFNQSWSGVFRAYSRATSDTADAVFVIRHNNDIVQTARVDSVVDGTEGVAAEAAIDAVQGDAIKVYNRTISVGDSNKLRGCFFRPSGSPLAPQAARHATTDPGDWVGLGYGTGGYWMPSSLLANVHGQDLRNLPISSIAQGGITSFISTVIWGTSTKILEDFNRIYRGMGRMYSATAFTQTITFDGSYKGTLRIYSYNHDGNTYAADIDFLENDVSIGTDSWTTTEVNAGVWSSIAIDVDSGDTIKVEITPTSGTANLNGIFFTENEDRNISIGGSISAPVAAADFEVGNDVAVAGTVSAPVAALTFEVANDVAVTGSISGPTAAITAEVGNDVAVTGSISGPTAAITAEVGNDVAVAGAISGPTAAIDINTNHIQVVGSITAPVGAIDIETGRTMSLAGAVSAPVAALTFETEVQASVAGTVSAPVAALTFETEVQASVAGTVSAPVAALTFETEVQASVAGTISAPVGVMEFMTGRSLSVVGAVSAPVAALTFETEVQASVAGTVSAPVAALTFEVEAQTSIAGSVSAPTGAVTLGVEAQASIAGSISGPTAAIGIHTVGHVSIAGTVSAPVAALTFETEVQASVAGSVSAPVGAVNLEVEVQLSEGGFVSAPTGAITIQTLVTQEFSLGGVVKVPVADISLIREPQVTIAASISAPTASGWWLLTDTDNAVQISGSITAPRAQVLFAGNPSSYDPNDVDTFDYSNTASARAHEQYNITTAATKWPDWIRFPQQRIPGSGAALRLADRPSGEQDSGGQSLPVRSSTPSWDQGHTGDWGRQGDAWVDEITQSGRNHEVRITQLENRPIGAGGILLPSVRIQNPNPVVNGTQQFPGGWTNWDYSLDDGLNWWWWYNPSYAINGYQRGLLDLEHAWIAPTNGVLVANVTLTIYEAYGSTNLKTTWFDDKTVGGNYGIEHREMDPAFIYDTTMSVTLSRRMYGQYLQGESMGWGLQIDHVLPYDTATYPTMYMEAISWSVFYPTPTGSLLNPAYLPNDG